MGNHICTQCTQTEYQLDTMFLQKCVQNSKFFMNIQQKNQIQRLLLQEKYYKDHQTNIGALYPYKNGYYQGYVQDQVPHGQGILRFIDQDRYQGSFRYGEFHQNGRLVSPKRQTTFQGKWQNGFLVAGVLYQNNQKNNNNRIQIQNIKVIGSRRYYATAKFPTKLIYEGQFGLISGYALQFDGQGEMNFPDGSRYIGSWVKGRMEGQGKYTWSNGDYYQGRYQNGQKSGPGKMYWKQYNQYYEGNWQDGQIIQQSIDHPTVETIEENISNTSIQSIIIIENQINQIDQRQQVN